MEGNLKTGIFVVGPTRTASTWLYENLKKLDGLSLSFDKELYFFDKNIQLGLDWYDKQFDDKGIRIDISPTYFSSLEAMKNIKEYNAEPVIMVVLRNQLELIVSKYDYCIQNGKFEYSIDKFWMQDCDEREEYLYYKYSVLWKKIIPEAKIVYVSFDLFKKDKLSFVKEILTKASINDYNEEQLKQLILTKPINRSGYQLRSSFAYNILKSIASPFVKRFNLKTSISVIRESILFRIFLKKKDKTNTTSFFNTSVYEFYRDDLLKIYNLVDFDLKYMDNK